MEVNPDQADPDQADPDQANPDQANPDQVNTNQANTDQVDPEFLDLMNGIASLHQDCSYLVMDRVPLEQAMCIFDQSDPYWIRRFSKVPNFRSIDDIYKYMCDGRFNPILIQSIMKYPLLDILIARKSRLSKKLFRSLFILISDGNNDAWCKAVSVGDQKLMIKLLDKNPKELYENNHNFPTAVRTCIKKGYYSVLEVLIAKKYKVNINNFDNLRFLAKSRFPVDKLVDLIDWDPYYISNRGTQLHKLLLHDLNELFLLVLKKVKYNLEWVSNTNNTVFMLACKRNENIALELIKHNCNPLYTYRCTNAYLNAFANGMTNICTLLMEKYGSECIPDPTPDFTALLASIVEYNNEAMALELINNHPEKCKPYITSVLGNALMCSMRLDNTAMKLIDTFGIDCCPGSIINDKTPLMEAMFYGQLDVGLKLLNTFGEVCNIHYVNRRGETAFSLLFSSYIRNYDYLNDIMEKFIEFGCCISSSMLTDAIMKCCCEKRILLLINHGVDISTQTTDLLIFACKKLYLDLATKLIEVNYKILPNSDISGAYVKICKIEAWKHIADRLYKYSHHQI